MMRTPPPTNASYLPSVSEGLEPPRSAAPPAWPALFPRSCIGSRGSFAALLRAGAAPGRGLQVISTHLHYLNTIHVTTCREGGAVMAETLRYRDCQEGIAAFKEKRVPVFCHTEDKVA